MEKCALVGDPDWLRWVWDVGLFVLTRGSIWTRTNVRVPSSLKKFFLDQNTIRFHNYFHQQSPVAPQVASALSFVRFFPLHASQTT